MPTSSGLRPETRWLMSPTFPDSNPQTGFPLDAMFQNGKGSRKKAVWLAAPAFSRPVPHLLNLEFPWRLELRLRDKALGSIKDVGCPLSTCDDPLVQSRSGDNQNVPANFASNKPRKSPPFSKSPATLPTLNGLEQFMGRRNSQQA